MSAARPALAAFLLTAACAGHAPIGAVPPFTPVAAAREQRAMERAGADDMTQKGGEVAPASLWSGGRTSLLGDRRAMNHGDIMTVVIEMDDRAEFSNASSRSRSASQGMQVPGLLGIPQRINEALPEGASLDTAINVGSQSDAQGTGRVRRNERLTLRVAATIVDVLPNGVLSIEGNQEVRVNFELRELRVSGFVRPEDVSRQNEITYDKIASARISYGGRGQIIDVQQPRYGQQALELISPF